MRIWRTGNYACLLIQRYNPGRMRHAIPLFAVLLIFVSAGCGIQARVETPQTPDPPAPTEPAVSSEPSPEPTATPRPTDPISPTPAPQTPAPTDAPPAPVFPFALPILPPGRDTIDPTYRFSTTQNGEREPHHGVEFLNSQGTPVHAAAAGTVLFAGDDYNGGPYSPKGWYAFYGQFVVLEHSLPGYDLPVYTLYAHLSEVLVETGQAVETGQQVGLVGFTGAAVGSHLHFEVRYGGFAYTDVRNPEAWLQPHAGNGSLAGAIRDENGLPLPVFSLQLTSVSDPTYTLYFSTYEEDALAYLAPFMENFALGDLPAGAYDLSFVAYTLETHRVEIRPGERTWLEITIGNGE